MLSFVHLSDINFNKFSGDNYDIDNDLRNEIILDIENEFPKYINNSSGILICGDIAFSGKEEEYREAIEFLKSILEKLSLKETDIYCVPGNHDVDQNVPKEEEAVYLLQKELEKQEDQNSYNAKIANIFRAKTSRKILYSPIECYNSNFAAKYSCDFTKEKPYWKNTLSLNDKYELAIWGINSTIISNADDHKDKSIERKMRLSRLQIPQRKANTIFMTLCHHPPECWNDENGELENLLNQRVMIQLYGHKHLQDIKINNNSIIVGSGATHPSRRESDWIPRYNWITIEIKIDSSEENLVVKIYPRIWCNNSNKFVCDEKNCENNKTKNVFSKYILKINSEVCDTNDELKENKYTTEIDNSWKRKL